MKCQGKISEKSGNFEVDDKWQPCIVNNASFKNVFFFFFFFFDKMLFCLWFH